MTDIRYLTIKNKLKLYKKLTKDDTVIENDDELTNRLLKELIYPINVPDEYIIAKRSSETEIIKTDYIKNHKIDLHNFKLVNGIYIHKISKNNKTNILIDLLNKYYTVKEGSKWFDSKQIISTYVDRDAST